MLGEKLLSGYNINVFVVSFQARTHSFSVFCISKLKKFYALVVIVKVFDWLVMLDAIKTVGHTRKRINLRFICDVFKNIALFFKLVIRRILPTKIRVHFFYILNKCPPSKIKSSLFQKSGHQMNPSPSLLLVTMILLAKEYRKEPAECSILLWPKNVKVKAGIIYLPLRNILCSFGKFFSSFTKYTPFVMITVKFFHSPYLIKLNILKSYICRLRLTAKNFVQNKGT